MSRRNVPSASPMPTTGDSHAPSHGAAPRAPVLARALATVLVTWGLLALFLGSFGARTVFAAPPPVPSDALDSPAPDSRLVFEPVHVTFAPGAAQGHEQVTLRVRNLASYARELDAVRITGEDWLGFELVEDVLPERLPRHGDVTLRIVARPEHFVVEDADERFAAINYRRRRAGQATVELVIDGRPHRVPLQFQPMPRGGLSLAAWVTVLLGLVAFLAAAAALAWRGRARSGHATREPTSAHVTLGPLGIVAIGVLALLPFAPAALDVAAFDALTLSRANDGLGGTRVHLDPTGLGAAILLGLWAWTFLTIAAMTPNTPWVRSRLTDRSAAWIGFVALAATCIAASTDAASAGLGDVIFAQSGTTVLSSALGASLGLRIELETPRWLSLASPALGVLSLVAMISTSVAIRRATDASSRPLSEFDQALLELAAAATLVTLVWGGPMPALGGSSTSVLALGVASLLLKSALLVGFARGLRRHLVR